MVGDERFTVDYAYLWERSGRFVWRIMRWSVYIRQAECPWMIVGHEGGFRTKTGARIWAWRWIREH